MRPVNLIPQEERKGQRAKSRRGIAGYLVLAALGGLLAGVVAVVLTGNQISERKAEIAGLEAREAAAVARADALRPYTQIAALAQTRAQTVDQLANSRFDWERVLNELALVIPSDVWLTEVDGSITSGSESSSTDTSSGEVAGPSLQILGCAASQDAVAGFVAALQDIDGVTRVGLQRSERGESGGDSSGGGSGDSGSSNCRTRDFIAEFEVTVAFDGATAAAGSATESSTGSVAVQDAADSGVTDATAQQQQAVDSAAEQTQEAKDGANLIGAGG